MKPHFLAAAISLAIALANAQAQTSAALQRPLAYTPTQVTNRSAQLIGAYSPAQKLRLAIGLRSPKSDEEQQFLEALYTPGSPEYHHFLTAQEFNERFAPSESDEQAVIDWAQSQGLTVVRRYSNRLLVDVEAPVSQIQRAFSVNINRYQLDGKAVFSNDRDPVIPPSLSGIVAAVVGLNNIEVMHSHANLLSGRRQLTYPDYTEEAAAPKNENFRANGSRAKLDAALAGRRKDQGAIPSITPEGGYEPIDLIGSNAYDFFALNNLGHCCNPTGNPGGAPVETSIAIASIGAFNMDDLAGFQRQYPFLTFNVTVVPVDGSTTTPDIEGTLDVEWAGTMANSFDKPETTAHIYLYEGPNPSFATFLDIYNRILNDGNARVMSTSWGAAEVIDASPTTMTMQDAVFNVCPGLDSGRGNRRPRGR